MESNHPNSQVRSSSPVAMPKLTRLPLGRTNRRLSFERRIRLWLAVLALPTIVSAALFTYAWSSSFWTSLGSAAGAAILWALTASFFFEQMIRPLQTLSNVVAALREDDFSFRARGARRGDSLGDLALEINALAATLQHQRSAARDALTLVERVLSSMQSPVFAFDATGGLRLLNSAARALLPLEISALDPIGCPAASLDLTALLETPDQGLYPAASSAHLSRWSVRRATFRLQGLPHTLYVLSDISAALREEERTAWQRLIRVLGHEINNSLTPIHSIAGTLRTRLAQASEIPAESADFLRGLAVIEDRSASLNRFLQAYQGLSRLPSPTLQRASAAHLVAAVAALETRLAASIHPGPPVTILTRSSRPSSTCSVTPWTPHSVPKAPTPTVPRRSPSHGRPAPPRLSSPLKTMVQASPILRTSSSPSTPPKPMAPASGSSWPSRSPPHTTVLSPSQVRRPPEDAAPSSSCHSSSRSAPINSADCTLRQSAGAADSIAEQ
jgi:two-component system nitrogen regulation sensor histidine kinase NtrY